MNYTDVLFSVEKMSIIFLEVNWLLCFVGSINENHAPSAFSSYFYEDFGKNARKEDSRWA